MAEQPLVSVIIPVYNGEKYLRETLQSVLTQNYDSFEVIVVDDGSDDGSAAIVEEFPRVRYFRQQNAGNATARNRGVHEAGGDYLAFLDQDDLWVPHKIRTHVDHHLANPDWQFSIARFSFFLMPGVERPSWCRPEWLEGDLLDFTLGSTVIRRDCFESVGPFDSNLKVGSDTDWHFRAKDNGASRGEIHEVLLHRRIHGSNQSQDPAFRTEITRIIRDSIRRKKRSIQ